MKLSDTNAAERRAAKSVAATPVLKAAMVACGLAALASGEALAAGGKVDVIDYDWSFEGPFGTFDEGQLQRGFQVYKEACAQCHTMSYLHYRDLGLEGGPNFPPAMVEAIAAQYEITVIDDNGDEIRRPALPTDNFRSPYENEEQARASGVPDLSLMTRARKGYTGIVTQILQGGGGPEYVYSLLLGYVDAPPNFEVGSGTYFNAYYPGHVIAMAPPLRDGVVDYQDDSPETVEQYAADVTAFLVWAADPHLEERKSAGLANLSFLVIFAILLWFSTKKLWKPIKRGEDA